MVTTDRPDHDALYHRFFGDPAVLAQLLREFVAGPWLDELDFDGMERLSTKFHADTGDRRESDLVWRIPRRDGGDAYVMLLLEFQSTPDPWMALRMLVYAGLLWQHVIRERRLMPDGRLPPILPIVLYNGDPRWRAPVALRDLIGLPVTSLLWRWQPDLRYHLIDEGMFSDEDLQEREGLPALLFRLEKATDPSQVVVLADAVLAWFSRYPGFEAAKKVFVDLLGAAMAPLGANVQVPEDLLEMRNMLPTGIEQWKQRWQEQTKQAWKQEGVLEGEQRGRQRGEAALLLRQLERRFGALPGWARERVLAADTVTLEDWGLRMLEASSLENIFCLTPTGSQQRVYRHS